MSICSIKVVALRVLALTLVGLLLASGAMAAGAVAVLQQPEDAYTAAGGSVTFSARAENDTGITWRLVSPDGNTVFLVKDVANYFPGVTVSGRNSDNLTLGHVPAAMDGWRVFCTYGGKNRVETERAAIHITDLQRETEAPAAIDEPQSDSLGYTYSGTDAMVVRVVGAALTVDGIDRGDSVDFAATGKIDFKVAAPERPEYWVINGARYDFEAIPRTITVRDLTYPMTLEAVQKGGTSQTLLSEDQLQQKRTGGTLLATTKNAEMCHINEKKYGAGGWFLNFDFTQDFENKATKRMEKGGRVTLRVRPFIPKGKVISYWKFNEAKLLFGSDVAQFFVFDLNETMCYQPVFKDAEPTPTVSPTEAPTPTPVPTYSVTSNGCFFTFERDSKRIRSRNNRVPAGTIIKVHPDPSTWWNSFGGYWKGSGFSAPSAIVNPDPIVITVNSDVSITWEWVTPIN